MAWLPPLVQFGLDAVVMEQCNPRRRDLPAKVQVRETPRCGREAHGYLQFLLREWHALPRHMVFVQGDAERHWAHAESPVLALAVPGNRSCVRVSRSYLRPPCLVQIQIWRGL